MQPPSERGVLIPKRVTPRAFDAPLRIEENPRVKILVVGGGGREHALVRTIRRSPLVEAVLCAPGNAGIARHAECVPIDPSNVSGLAALASSRGIDLTVVGPELPLTLGIRKEFERRHLALFGPSRAAAEIESSKAFSKQFMRRNGIPTGDFEIFRSSREARSYLRGGSARYPLVVKADGLAAGKGVVICRDPDEGAAAVDAMMDRRVHGSAGEQVVVEEFLEGREASFFVITDGDRIVPLAACQDYKRVGEGDAGPNTGGMGAYSPNVHLSEVVFGEVMDRIIDRTIAGLSREGRPYQGLLYAGLMLTEDGPRVLEYNARFGDPETQALLPRMESDLVPLLAAAASSRLEKTEVSWRSERSVSVVIAAAGYPGAIRKGMPIRGIDAAESVEGVTVSCAGVSAGPGSELLVAGGRVLTVTALGRDLEEAIGRAYDGAGRISFEGMQYRRDIARDAVAAGSAARRDL